MVWNAYWPGFSRETETVGCVYTEKEIYFKKLAHVTIVTREEPMLLFKSKGNLLAEFFSAGEFIVFLLLRPLTDWKSPIY